MSTNPLSNFFRQPAVHLKLPSNGKYWREDALDLPVTNEIPVYPMTTRDEITLRTPDALLNGSGVVELIQNCCPNILDAWGAPSIDIDAIIIAIRIASYGNIMDFDNRCPFCNEENTHQIDLTAILDNIKAPDFAAPLKHKSLTFKLKPQHYFSVNASNKYNFEEQQLFKNIDTIESEEEKLKFYAEQLQRITDMTIQLVTDSTEYILTPDGIKVSDAEFIKEFYERAETKVVNLIRDRLKELAVEAEIPRPTVSCSACDKQYEVTLTFDYASFFGKGF
jgi:hypothetical protein